MTADQQAVAARLQAINDAWTGGRVGDLRDLLHPGIVVVGGDLTVHADGREACLRGFADFVERATIREFRPEEPRIDVFEDTAVAGYDYRIEYTLEGTTYLEGGHDVWLFVRTGGEWLAVWRMLTFEALDDGARETEAAP